MRPHLKTILIALITVGLIAWFFRQANLGDVWREIRAADAWALGLALVMTGVTYVLRALRWQYMLQSIGPTRFSVAFRTTVIGFAANAVLPARVGEVLRPYLLARREGLTLTATFATIILERLLDLLTVLLLFGAFVLFFDPGMASVNAAVFAKVKAAVLLFSAIAIAAFIVIVVLARQPATFGRVVDRVAGVLPSKLGAPLSRLAHTFMQGLAVMADPVRLTGTLLLSLPLWMSIAGGVWFAMVAFHMTIPYTGSFLILALLAAGVAVPTPGAVGGFHEAFRLGVTAFYGVDNDRAVGAAIVLHALSFFPVALLGAWFMFRDGLDLAGVRRVSEEVREIEEAEHDAEAAAHAVTDRPGADRSVSDRTMADRTGVRTETRSPRHGESAS